MTEVWIVKHLPRCGLTFFLPGILLFFLVFDRSCQYKRPDVVEHGIKYFNIKNHCLL